MIYPRPLAWFRMLVFFTNLSLMEFQVRYLVLFLLFSVIDGFKWFWMGSLLKNIQLMLEFLKAPFLVLHFSFYTLMTFLMMLSVILPSKLMILLSILSVIKGKKWLVDFNTGKTQLVLFDRSNNTGSIDVKMDGPVLEEKSSFKMLGLTIFSELHWDSYIISSAKSTSRKIGALIRSVLWSFYLLKLLCISKNPPYAHVWNTVVTSATWNC